MKLIMAAALAIVPLMAKDSGPVKRLGESATVFSEVMQTPDKGIPQDLLAKARCIVIVPSVSGVNYFSLSATIILPYRRQLPSSHRGSALLHWC
jgi:lipid-binding SYLF domain-containing protein